MAYFGEPDVVYVTAGTVREGELPRTWQHIFLREKVGWWDVVEDGMVRWEGFPGEG